MKYHITHKTTYTYAEMVPGCHNQAHLAPRDHPYQTCAYHRLVIKPSPAHTNHREDYFGNKVSEFSIHETHRKMTVTATSRVEVRPQDLPPPEATPPWEQIRDGLPRDLDSARLASLQFVFDSPAVQASPELADYAAASFPAGRPVLEAVLELTARIHADFTYSTGATDVTTPLAEAFRLRQGVCQDFAHVQIGCLRSLGLSAQYVSGYLRTIPPPGADRLVGADASHAWLAVDCGSPLGWVDVDPTNGQLVGTDHITIAWGRDFTDVSPIRGMFIGGGEHALTVAVDVVPQQ